MTDNPDPLSLSYYAQAVSYPIPTLEEENQIIARAKLGCPIAKETIITSCLGYVLAVARTLSLSRNIEFDELVGIGNLILVEHLEEALTKTNAYSFLKTKVKWRLLDYCQRYSYYYELSGREAAYVRPTEPERDYY